MPSPNLVAAALTQRTRRIKIGILGNLPALHAHPVRLAEEIAMLDLMSGGRIISGFVRGVPQEYLALSVPLAEARERLEEAWDVIVKAWTTREPFEWHGKHFDYDRVCIWPRPLQEPHPPIVLAGRQRRGPRLRGPPARADGRRLSLDGAEQDIFDRLSAVRGAHGWTPAPADCHLMRHIYVAETNARAREEAEPHLDYFWQKLLSYHRGSMKLSRSEPAAAARRRARRRGRCRSTSSTSTSRRRKASRSSATPTTSPRRSPRRCASWARACSWGSSSSAACRTRWR